MTQTAVDAYAYVVEQLAARGHALNPKGQTRCPAHADTTPSLTVTRKDDRVLVHCHAGCTVDAVCQAIGITPKDLYNAAPKQEPKRVVATYTYRDEQAIPLYEKIRYQPKTFAQRRIVNGTPIWGLADVRRVLYNLDKFATWAATDRPLFVVEGERDADTLTKHGYHATTLTDGAGKWRPEYTEQLSSFSWIVIIADNDAPGKQHAAHVAHALEAVGIAVTVALPTHGKDITDQISELGAANLADQLDYHTADTWQTWLNNTDDEAEDETDTTDVYTWADLTAYIDGTHVDIETTLCATDTKPLIYAGKLHTLAGEPGMGKTWVACIATAQELNAGNQVAWIDLEDTPSTLIKRLRQLGVTNFTGLRYAAPPTRTDTTALLEQTDGIHLIVVDAMSEIAAQYGADTNDNSAITTIISNVLRPLTSSGAAVLIVDHVAKNSSGDNRWAIGAQHKLAAVDGAAYILETDEAVARGRESTLVLKIAKDRHGAVGPMKTTARLLYVAATEAGDITWTWHTPAPDTPGNRLNTLAHAIYDYVAGSFEPPSQRDIEREVKGNSARIRDAIRDLIEGGYLTFEPGAKRSLRFKTNKFLAADRDIYTTESDQEI